jgi:hypothetical protein
MARDIEHFYILGGICTPSFGKALFCLFVHFFVGSLILGEFSFLSSLYILNINLLSDV